MKRLCLLALLVVAALSASAEDIVAPADRNVTPPGMTPGPRVDGPLERIPPPPTPPPKARWWRFFLPVTTDAATFRTDDRTIHIAGVEPPPVDAVCPLADGTSWPCGRTALYSLRRFLHGRAVECYFAKERDADAVTAPCRVGTGDIGLWLLSEGWARPDDGASDAYRKAATEALCTGRGVWRGQALPADCPPPPPGGGT